MKNNDSNELVDTVYKEVISGPLLEYIEDACKILNDIKYLGTEETLAMKLTHIINTASEEKMEYVEAILILDIWELLHILNDITSINLNELESGTKLENDMYNHIYHIIKNVYEASEEENSTELVDTMFEFMDSLIKLTATHYVFKAELSEHLNNHVGIYKAKYEKDEYLNNQSNKMVNITELVSNIANGEGYYNSELDQEIDQGIIDDFYSNGESKIRASNIKPVNIEKVRVNVQEKIDFLHIFSDSMDSLFKIISMTEEQDKENKAKGVNKIQIKLEDYPEIDDDFLEVILHKK